jgi:putative ABC transport system permease protein
MADWRADVDRRLDRIGLPPTRRADILEEVEAFLQGRYEDFLADGYAPAEARRLALADLETDRFIFELSHIERRAPAELPPIGSGRSTIVANLWQDVRHGLRAIRRAPGFSAVVIATLALGIGANAAIFSVADAVMLRPYAYPDMERIVVINERTRSGQSLSVAWPNFQDWRDQNQVFQHLGLFRNAVVNLTGSDRPERLISSVTSSAVFGALGVAPSIGRVFSASDDVPSAPRVVIVSERLWRTRFDADPQMVGRAILLNGEPHTVVGVMPPEMRFPSRLTDVWLPLGPVVPSLPTARGAHPGLIAVAKMKPGVTLERAVVDMDTIARRLEQQYPDSNSNLGVELTLYFEQIVRNIRPTLLTLLGAVAFVLIIACANLANLLLARSERRQRELAVRRALGANRWRMVQQLLMESLLLAVIGGAIGVVLASWLVNLFVASGPVTVPRIDLVGVDARVVAFSALVTIATGIFFGLVPALRASAPDLRSTLNEVGRGTLLVPARRLRSALIVAEVALALMLLVGAGLMIRSFARLMSIEPGFDPANVVTMRLTLPPAKYREQERWQAIHQDLVERVATLPGVTSAAINSGIPLEGGGSESGVRVEGRPIPPVGTPGPMCLFQTGSPDYFRTMGIALVKGRYFDARDTASSSRVAIIDETFVRTLFPGEDPIGKRISFESQGEDRTAVQIWREVVGVVRHVRHYGLAQGPPYVQVYTPFAQLPIWFERRRPTMALFVRTTIAPERLTASVRERLASLDGDIPVYGVQTMQTYLAQNTEQPRLNVMLLGGLAALALILATLGVYGVVSYSVAQRTQEIGVRMALGATRAHVLRLVVGQASAVVLLGVVLGLGGALALASLLQTLLFQVSARDPVTFATVAVVLAVIGFAATIVPARRATQVDPLVAIREA